MYDPEYSPNAAAEQQQELLIQGRFQQPPTSAAHLADRMEAGGAKIEETLARLNWNASSLFFLAGWIVIFSSIGSLIGGVLSLSPLQTIQSIFLLVFGFLMMVLDVPGAPRWAARYRVMVRRQCRFLTRFTGKGLWFIYLGTLIAALSWPTGKGGSGVRRAGFFLVVGLFLASLVISIGLIGLSIAIRKSLRLNKVRTQVLATYKGNVSEVYRKYAITDPTHGMQFEEFNRMASDYTQGRTQFDINDIAIIYNALDDHQKSAINEREFTEWVAGPLTYL